MSRSLKQILAMLAMAGALGCARPAGDDSTSRVEIEVTENGFVPAVVTIPANKPAILVVTRKSNATCATEFVMKSQNINQPLPMNQPVEIQIAAQTGGDLDYACAMDMYKGKVSVKK